MNSYKCSAIHTPNVVMARGESTDSAVLPTPNHVFLVPFSKLR